MEIRAEEFGLKLDNIPAWNLRNEFVIFRDLLAQEEFRSLFHSNPLPITTPYLTWYGMPGAFLTLILQRAILGIEAYVTVAVFHECGLVGKLNKDMMKYFRNPFLLGGRGTAENHYNRLPLLHEERHQLRQSNPALWERTRRFYVAVRNPLFHGFEVDGGSVHGVLTAYQLLDQLYAWIDGWHNPDKVLPGSGSAWRSRGSRSVKDV